MSETNIPSLAEYSEQLLISSPRIKAMFWAIYTHREMIDRFDTGALVLNFHGIQVKPQLDKVALNGIHS